MGPYSTRRVVVIVNPTAGNGRAARIRPEVERALRSHGLTFAVFATAGPGDATSLASTAVESGCDLVIAVGGDGTLNEVVNGLLANRALTPPTLGVVSCGSGCDFIRSLGIPRGVPAVAVIARGNTRLIDVGRVTYEANDGQSVGRY